MKNFDNVVGIILAGGEGRRLKPLTNYIQKCMIPVGGSQKPLLEYILINLMMHGILDVTILVGYKHKQIMNYFDDGNRFGARISYFIDDITLPGSGGSLLNAATKWAFKDESTMLVHYGDILSNINISEMIKQHIETDAAATLAVTNGLDVPVGVAEVQGKVVKAWVEKPRIDICAGIGVVAFSPRVLKALKQLAVIKMRIDIMGDLIPYLLEHGEKVEAYFTDAFWYDVGSMERYEKIDNDLINKIFN